jgi:hypothetical protein
MDYGFIAYDRNGDRPKRANTSHSFRYNKIMGRSLHPTFTLALLLLASCFPTGRTFSLVTVRAVLPPTGIASPLSSGRCRRYRDDLPYTRNQNQLDSSSKQQDKENPASDESISSLKNKKSSSFRARLPMWLTYSRCVMIPALVYAFYQPQSHIVTPLIFGVASFTDWLDGYLARRWKVESSFGAFLDPVVCYTFLSQLFSPGARMLRATDLTTT